MPRWTSWGSAAQDLRSLDTRQSSAENHPVWLGAMDKCLPQAEVRICSLHRGVAWNWSWNICLFYRWERQCFTVFRDGSKVVRSKSCLALLLVIIWAFLSCILYSEWGRGEEALINTSLQVDCAVPCLHFCIVKVQHQSHACNTPDTPTSSHDFWRQNKVNCLHELIKYGLDFHIKFFPGLVGHFNPALGTFAHYRKHHFLWNAKKFLAFGHHIEQLAQDKPACALQCPPMNRASPLWTQRLNYNSFLAGLPAACVESCVACSLTSLGNWKHFPFNIPTAVCPSLHCQHMHLVWLLLFSGQPFILRSTPRSARFLTWLLAGSFWGLKDSQQLLFLGMDLMQVWVSVLKQDGFQFL